MSSKNEKLTECAARFRWIDDNTIHLINIEGIERIVDLTNNKFKEVEFNFIPLYDNKICKTQHYILDPPSMTASDTLERLKRKY